MGIWQGEVGPPRVERSNILPDYSDSQSQKKPPTHFHVHREKGWRGEMAMVGLDFTMLTK